MKDKDLIKYKIVLDRVSVKIVKSFIIGVITSIIIGLITILFFPYYAEKTILIILFVNGFSVGAVFTVMNYYNDLWKELKEIYRGELENE